MKKLLFTAAAAITLFGCTLAQNRPNPYEKPQFYSRYLAPDNPLDQKIQRALDSLRLDPRSPSLHNDLGALLVQKGFPKDATIEFKRALDADRRFYPAWYNLGLVRSAEDDYPLAHHAFSRTIHYKPGHSAALFQLALLEEKYHHDDLAIQHLAKALAINPALLDVRMNPRILDTKLVPFALLKLYPKQHARESLQFQGTPAGYEAAKAGRTEPPARPAGVQTAPAQLQPVQPPSTTAQPPPTTWIQPAPRLTAAPSASAPPSIRLQP